MLVGYPPFFSEDRMVLYQNILAGRIEYAEAPLVAAIITDFVY